METTLNPAMIRPKFYTGRRDTRWDPYPGQEPLKVVAHDYYGFWEYSTEAGCWFKTPTSYNLVREITKVEADTLLANGEIK